MQRRHLLTAALGVAGSALVAPSSRAQGMAYPVRPIKLVVGFPPGGGIDFTARAIQPGLEAALGQPIVIEYKPGAGGVLAASDLSRAAPDGYTLLVANTGPFAIAPYLQSKAPYDPVRQFTYIGQIAEAGYVVATRSDHPARDLKGFVDWARANAGKANYASGGIGSSTHLNGELLNGVAGLDLLEKDIFADNYKRSTVVRLYELKRELNKMRMAVAPLQDVLAQLRRYQGELIPDEVKLYIRDVHDHAVRISDVIDTLREMLGTALSVNLSLVTLAQGETVKRLGAWAALLAAPTLITSWYGMNFTHMPELDQPWAYPAMIIGVGAVCVGLDRLFKRVRWL